MLSILEPETARPSPPETAPEVVSEPADFEVVLGPAQIASWLFVGVIAIAVCSSLAFLAGKSTGLKQEIAAAYTVAAGRAAEAQPAPVTASAATPAPMPSASILVPPKTDLASVLKTAQHAGPQLFAEPEVGKVYIQIGAVEKGMATILTEGLRSHGFDAFVAAGPSEKIYRVLIGPLPDPESFRQAKAAVDAIDLTTFARKYEK
jgi:cell division septation protein DedD